MGKVALEPVLVCEEGGDALKQAEARLRRFTRPALIRLHAEAAGSATTRLRVESDALAWAPMFRRFRVDLLTLERPVS